MSNVILKIIVIMKIVIKVELMADIQIKMVHDQNDDLQEWESLSSPQEWQRQEWKVEPWIRIVIDHGTFNMLSFLKILLVKNRVKRAVSGTLYKKSPISDRRSLPFLMIIMIRISIIRIIMKSILNNEHDHHLPGGHDDGWSLSRLLSKFSFY